MPHLDYTPLVTDWDDFQLLWDDMARFLKENPKHTIIAADDPGVNHVPPRVGRIGWSAFLVVPRGEDEKARHWSITLQNFVRTLQGCVVEDLFKTASGRRQALQILRNRLDVREPPPIPNRFQREPPL
jgi:hypothetical protein